VLVLRLVNRVLAALLSLAVVAAVVVLVVEVVRWSTGAGPWVVPWQRWGDALVDLQAGDRRLMLVATVAALAGLALLWFELAPRGPKTLPVAPLADDVSTVTTRKGLEVAAESAARGVSGVRSASARAGRSRIKVTAGVRARGVASEVEDGVRAAVGRTLDDLQLQRRPGVRVKVEEDR
jgi:hypothetical protein